MNTNASRTTNPRVSFTRMRTPIVCLRFVTVFGVNCTAASDETLGARRTLVAGIEYSPDGSRTAPAGSGSEPVVDSPEITVTEAIAFRAVTLKRSFLPTSADVTRYVRPGRARDRRALAAGGVDSAATGTRT